MPQPTLYVRKDCPHSQRLGRMLETYPEKLRQQLRISEISFHNRPPNVTRVPTLITHKGDMLVGEDVFSYLKRWRYDASPPHTEAFAAIKKNQSTCILLVIAILLTAYWYYTSRGRGFGTGLGLGPLTGTGLTATGGLF